MATKRTKKSSPDATPAKGEVRLLAGGNPQIAKADGDAPVQEFIAAMPGWKHAIGRRMDRVIESVVPNVLKAVRWNTPFYGVEGQGWFLGFHCFTKYIKVSFHNGASLTPEPPIKSKHPTVRYLHLHEDDFDEEQFRSWVKQSAALPGEKLF